MNVYSVRLPQRTQGATASPIRARFLLPDGTVVDLTGATITATKKNINTDAPVTSITGTVAPDVGEAADGWFNWDLSADDVGESGLFLVQFRATGGVAFDATSQGEWYLHPLQDAQAVASPAIVGVTSVQRCAMDNANAPDCANPFATMADVGTGGIPLIDPAVAGNLAVQTAGGELVDAGYAADENATDGTVVRRRGDGRISAKGVGGGTGAFEANVPTGFGAYSFLTRKNNVERSAIESDNGTLIFLGASADANRLAQTNEVQAVSFGGAQTITAPQQVQARANIAAETAGTTATHAGLTGTAVHGLGTASTLTAGATGSSLVTSATVTAARFVLELPPATSPPIYTLHNGIATKATVVTGSGAVTAGQPEDLASGATALSTARLNVGLSALSLGYGNARWDWSRRFELFGNLRRQTVNIEGVARIFYGKRTSDAFGVVAAGDYVAIELANGVPTAGIVAKAGVVTTLVFVSPPAATQGMNWYIISINGTVSWWSNNVLLGTTTAGPVATGVIGNVVYELQNGATAAEFRLSFLSASNGYL